ncbi:inactive peptidyl-prolyl cis-trans isomerase FKBP6 isoform X2 [Eleutherodactylus coqui]|uniref:inactive peptidyl-prolyl cis-trans isomerase FKBP6 isoform X2 n=1 Tax=Eleutherodactylus coqui TaxID=57060 RepID=UPI0034626F92
MEGEEHDRNGVHNHSCAPRPRVSHGLSVFEKLAQNMQDISGDRGVLKEMIRAGSGEKVPSDATLILKFSGYLEHSDRPFETNWFRRYPRLMKLGEDITLLGMEVSVLTMQRGELSRFLYSPDYAYGTMGCPPLIPPAATVLFEIEVLDYLDTAESDAFCELSLHQQSTFLLEKVLKIAATERQFGNYLFRRDRFYDAKGRYKRACLELREYEKARTFLLRAQKFEPFNLEINSELKRLSSCYKAYMDRQRAMCVRMFAPPSSTAV